MIIEAVLLKTFADAWKASDIDDKALNTLRRAYDTHENAVTLFERRKQAADISLKKLVNRKKAIYTGRMKEFLDVYSKSTRLIFVRVKAFKNCILVLFLRKMRKNCVKCPSRQ